MRVLKKGMEGEPIRELQQLLNRTTSYTMLEDTGIFDKRTEQAVMKHQQRQTLVVTGTVSHELMNTLQQTWQKMQGIPQKALLDVPELSPLRGDGNALNTPNTSMPLVPKGIIGEMSFTTGMFKTFGFWILVVNVLKYFKKG